MQLRLLTLNMYLRPPLIQNGYSDFKQVRLERLFHRLEEYDIVTLQEVFTANTKSKLIQVAQSKGFKYHKIGPTSNILKGKFTDSGLLILSKYPIIESSLLVFERGIKSDALASKGAIYTKIQIQSFYVNLITTHLQASYGEEQTAQIRILQLNQLVNWISEMKLNEHDYLIVTGDLNINGMNEKNYQELYLFYQVTQSHPITFGEDIYGRKTVQESLDYIFYKPNPNWRTVNVNIEAEKYGDAECHSSCLVPCCEYCNPWKRIHCIRISDHYGISFVSQLV